MSETTRMTNAQRLVLDLVTFVQRECPDLQGLTSLVEKLALDPNQLSRGVTHLLNAVSEKIGSTLSSFSDLASLAARALIHIDDKDVADVALVILERNMALIENTPRLIRALVYEGRGERIVSHLNPKTVVRACGEAPVQNELPDQLVSNPGEYTMRLLTTVLTSPMSQAILADIDPQKDTAWITLLFMHQPVSPDSSRLVCQVLAGSGVARKLFKLDSNTISVFKICPDVDKAAEVVRVLIEEDLLSPTQLSILRCHMLGLPSRAKRAYGGTVVEEVFSGIAPITRTDLPLLELLYGTVVSSRVMVVRQIGDIYGETEPIWCRIIRQADDAVKTMAGAMGLAAFKTGFLPVEMAIRILPLCGGTWCANMWEELCNPANWDAMGGAPMLCAKELYEMTESIQADRSRALFDKLGVVVESWWQAVLAMILWKRRGDGHRRLCQLYKCFFDSRYHIPVVTMK